MKKVRKGQKRKHKKVINFCAMALTVFMTNIFLGNVMLRLHCEKVFKVLKKRYKAIL